MTTEPIFVPDDFGEDDADPAGQDDVAPQTRGPSRAAGELVDPSDPDSDYRVGDWWEKRGPTPNRPLIASRCVTIKKDGTRCRCWSVNGLTRCPTHSGQRNLPNVREMQEQTMHNARMALLRIVPEALSRIEQIIEDETGTIPASVQLKASTEVLDRTGIRGGTEIDVRVEDATDPGQVLRARLEQLRERAAVATAALTTDVVDAEIVGDETDQMALWDE